MVRNLTNQETLLVTQAVKRLADDQTLTLIDP
jgi:hypothetical protein